MNAVARVLLAGVAAGFFSATAHAFNYAYFIGWSWPGAVSAGEAVPATITMRNGGANPWSPWNWYRLGSQNPQDNWTWGTNRVLLPGQVNPGQDFTFSGFATAPSTPGLYNFQWRMVQDGVEWFGEFTPNGQIWVTGNQASYVSQSVPSTISPGQTAQVSVTMRNAGSWTWYGDHRLGSQNPQDNFTWGTNRIFLAYPVYPGQDYTFTFNITAPSTPGVYNFQWKMVHDGWQWFGQQSPNVTITVGAPGGPQELATGCEAYGLQAATDKRVFNWYFYLNAQADLNLAGMNTPQSACAHWMEYGRKEGRQAHAGFQSHQYLQRYPDVAGPYGTYGEAAFLYAIGHYISNGIAEGRTGYVENGLAVGWQRTTVQGSYAGGKIFVSASSRMAGAIDSVMVDNYELINATDHGRELQVAFAEPPWGEGYNPTEGGSCDDGSGFATTSVLNSSSASNDSYSSSVTPSFWWRPNSPCGSAHNTTALATGFRIDKQVQVGFVLPNVIRFATQIQLYEDVPRLPSENHSLAGEAPTAYMPADLNKAFRISASGNPTEVTALAEACGRGGAEETFANCNHPEPIVHTNSAGTYALGICSGFSSWYRSSIHGGNAYSATTKWNAGFVFTDPLPAGSTLSFVSFVIVGKQIGGSSAMQNVISAMQTLRQQGYCS